MLYAIKYWVPFPDSEYGGLVIVRGNGLAEVEKALRDSSLGDRAKEFPKEFLNAIQNAKLLNEFGTPEVLEYFLS